MTLQGCYLVLDLLMSSNVCCRCLSFSAGTGRRHAAQKSLATSLLPYSALRKQVRGRVQRCHLTLTTEFISYAGEPRQKTNLNKLTS